MDPLSQTTRILRIRMNHSNAGFFACLTFALNQLRYAEEHGLHPVVHFGKASGSDQVGRDGLNAFYDERFGTNSWDYYFEPVAGYTYESIERMISDPEARLSSGQIVSLDDDALWALHFDEPRSMFTYPYGCNASIAASSEPEAWYEDQRARARTLLERYVRVKPHIRDAVDRYWAEHLRDAHVLGIHMRGTDKGNRDARTGKVVAKVAPDNLTRIVRAEEYFFCIDAYLEENPDARMFLATEQGEFVEAVRKRYGERVLSRKCIRGKGFGIGSNPFQLRDDRGYEKGEDILIDCLLLSRCDFLLKCTSAVGEYALAWHEQLRGFDLNHHAPGSFPYRSRLRGRALAARAETDERRRVGVVVNYFSKRSSDDAHDVLVDSTALSLRLLKLNPGVGAVLLVDGSQVPDTGMRDRCEEMDVEYFHAGRQTSYVEAYNFGWRSMAEDFEFVGLMANDVLPHPAETIERLLRLLRRDKDVGCVFPYLSSGRLQVDETQRPGFFGRSRKTCEPASMTLNLNIFRREVLEAVGGLDEAYVYGYAEPILISKIRKLGYRVVMVGKTQVYHYDRLTKLLGASALTDDLHAADTRRWFEEYAEYASRDGIANLHLAKWPFSTTRRARWMWRFCYGMLRGEAARRAMRVAIWLEPYLTRYPARFGKRKP